MLGCRGKEQRRPFPGKPWPRRVKSEECSCLLLILFQAQMPRSGSLEFERLNTLTFCRKPGASWIPDTEDSDANPAGKLRPRGECNLLSHLVLRRDALTQIGGRCQPRRPGHDSFQAQKVISLNIHLSHTGPSIWSLPFSLSCEYSRHEVKPGWTQV